MPETPQTDRRPWWRHLRTVGAVAGSAVVAAATVLVAVPAAADAPPPGGDVETSDNMTHVANVPFEAPFDYDGGTVGTDIAFTDDHAVVGNYLGFHIYDISDPTAPEVVSQVLCPGGQMDVSVSGDLAYFSVDRPMASEECGAPPISYFDPSGWEGMRIFDISDKANPEYVSSVRTDCGSHTHTLVPGDESTDYIYVSSYLPGANYVQCGPEHDKISVVEVPLDDPASAHVAATPVLFPDGGYDNPGGLLPTSGCHDITVFPEENLAAGACMGDGIVMDISDPLEPVVLDEVQDDNFAFWHSATFTNRADTVLFTDELGGGGAATCNEQVGPERGANAFYTIEGSGADSELEFASYFKIPRHQEDTENCVAHNGSLIPVPGRDYFVQAWYQGGVSVIDFNDVHNPKEIAYFDRGPFDPDVLDPGGIWSAYWYNGYIYASDIYLGLDVLRVEDPRLRAADRVTFDEFNAQTQPRYRPGQGRG